MSDWKALEENLVEKELADVGTAGSRMVHGADDRQPVLDTTAYPASAIAQVIVTASDGETFSATATFIAPRLLLTAGHALHVPGGGPGGGNVQRVVVVPGRNGATTPFGADTAQAMWVHPHWQSHGLRDFDCGLLRVAPLASVGTFAVAALSDQQLQRLAVVISGYPSDKPTGTQWFDTRTIAAVSPGQLAYDIDTEVGQSGSPVFSFDGQRATVVGIHQFGDLTENYGTRITPPLLAAIQAQRTAWGV